MRKEEFSHSEGKVGYSLPNLSRHLPTSSLRILSIATLILVFVHIRYSLSNPQPQITLIKRNIGDVYSLNVQQNMRAALVDAEAQSAAIPPLRTIGKEHFEVIPSLRISHCRVLKSMSTVLTNLMCYIYNSEEFVQLNRSISTGMWDDRFCEPNNHVDSFAELERRLPFGYSNFAVIREPLSRFVSGYLDQCVRKETCLGCTASDLYCVFVNLRESLAERAPPSKKKFKYDHALMHLAPQSWYCNMSKVYKSTIFIKYESGEFRNRMISEILHFLKESGVAEKQMEFIRDDLMSGGRTRHSTENWEGVNETKAAIKMNSTLLSLFMEIFQYDYKLFGFSVPT